ncbi:type IV toxin-antitoxin system AbiEi family antitoxin domain-containing protein [Jeotgalibaca ciconiae]|uniref:type IV toxin-antitoxin system AbiEi family antitoxin domain-containing protein n=1 Tax=Jeotgalibaca ciconiae TaxID=2496265 RepID=UPI0013DF1F00|nr:type IV toxin-antitoxin system AbiEi family antitoxin domain-containing protein [Jeotgalibaca ciconiae]
MIQSKLTQLFIDNNGILMAKQTGFDDSTLRKAVERDDIKKHSRGIYLLDESH